MIKNMNLHNLCKYSIAIFIAFLIPIYCYYYGPLNFLLFSDVGLFLTVLILWLNSSLINSMASVGILSLEIVWCLDFIGDLLRNLRLTNFDLVDGLSDYMFENNFPLPLRLMSLFHVVLPIAWIYYLYKWGYNRKGLIYFIPLYWADITLTYLLTDPAKNTNWVFLAQTDKLTCLTQTQWLLVMYFVVPIVLFVPMHLILTIICKPAKN